MGELLSIAALFMFSANIIFTKIASKKMSVDLGFIISVLVNIIFGSILLIGQLLLRNDYLQIHYISLLLFIVSGFFSTYLGRLLFYKTIAKLGAARASTFQVSNPLFTVIIAWVVLGENLKIIDIFSIISILLGLFLVSYVPPSLSNSEIKENLLGEQSSIFKVLNSGVIIALVSAFAYAIGNVLRGIAVHDWNEPILGGLVGALVGFLSHYIFHRKTRSFWALLRGSNKKSLFFYILSGIMTISAQICVIAAMWYIPVSIANLITLSTPVIVTPLSYFLLKNQEGITVRTVVGSAMVLTGIMLIIFL